MIVLEKDLKKKPLYNIIKICQWDPLIIPVCFLGSILNINDFSFLNDRFSQMGV